MKIQNGARMTLIGRVFTDLIFTGAFSIRFYQNNS